MGVCTAGVGPGETGVTTTAHRGVDGYAPRRMRDATGRGTPQPQKVLAPRSQACSLDDVDMAQTEAENAGRQGPDDAALERAARTLIRAAAACASFCEHVEHNEPTTTHEVVGAAEELRQTAAALAKASNLSLLAAYATRIRGVEAASILRHTSGIRVTTLDGADALDSAESWEEVQVAQLVHDRQFHPDVFGLSKVDQLRHYTFHVTKLAGLLVDAIDDAAWLSFQQERLADIAIFGVKLATVCNERLPPTPVDGGRSVGKEQGRRPRVSAGSEPR